MRHVFLLTLFAATAALAIGCTRSRGVTPRSDEACYPPAAAVDITMGRTEVKREPLGPLAKLPDGTSRPTFARLRRDDALSICGVKNGDIWLGVNGVEMDSPERALSEYQRLIEVPLWTLDLLRDGRRLRVVIDVR